jgi:hypothetical protein
VRAHQKFRPSPNGTLPSCGYANGSETVSGATWLTLAAGIVAALAASSYPEVDYPRKMLDRNLVFSKL